MSSLAPPEKKLMLCNCPQPPRSFTSMFDHAKAILHTLPQADGSATYTHCSYTIIAAVNGPIEPQRRDERPEDAFIEVIVRPGAGVGGPRERHVEMLIQALLRDVIDVKTMPRTLLQVVLQIASESRTTRASGEGASILPMLPHLLHAALLALLSANTPLTKSYTSVLVAIGGVPEQPQWLSVDPSPPEIASAKSLHVFAFASQQMPASESERNGEARDEGSMLLADSDGIFNVQNWKNAKLEAQKRCFQLEQWLRQIWGADLQDRR